jgi:ABC-type glycerol-3-phosphate transport system substrate-binding protein
MARTTTHEREAEELLRFLSSEAAHEKYMLAGLALPAMKVAGKNTGYPSLAMEAAARALVQGEGIEDPRSCDWPDTKANRINPVLERLGEGELSPEKAFEALNRDLASHPPSMIPPERKPPAQNKPQMFLF